MTLPARHPLLQLQARVGQALSIALPGLPGAGMPWRLEAAPPGCAVDEAPALPAGAGIDAAATQRFTVRCSQPGRQQLRFVLKRPWQDVVQAVQPVSLQVLP